MIDWNIWSKFINMPTSRERGKIMKYPVIRDYLKDYSKSDLQHFVDQEVEPFPPSNPKEFMDEAWWIIEELADDTYGCILEYLESVVDVDIKTRREFNDFIKKIAVAHVAKIMLDEMEKEKEETEKDENIIIHCDFIARCIKRSSIKSWSYTDNGQMSEYIDLNFHPSRMDGEDILKRRIVKISDASLCGHCDCKCLDRDKLYINTDEFKRLKDWLFSF